MIRKEQQCCPQAAGNQTAVLHILLADSCADRHSLIRANMQSQFSRLKRKRLRNHGTEFLLPYLNPHLYVLLSIGFRFGLCRRVFSWVPQ